MKETVIDSLRRAEMFQDLADRELLQVAQSCQIWELPANHVIFNEGDDGNEFCIIQEGCVRISLTTRSTDGSFTQGTINLLFAGQVFGEMVLLDGATRSATVTSIDPVVLLVLNKQDFTQLCESNPHIGYRAMLYLARDLAYKLRSSNLLLRGNIRWQHNELGQFR